MTNAEHHAMKVNNKFLINKMSELPHHYFSQESEEKPKFSTAIDKTGNQFNKMTKQAATTINFE